MPLIGLSRTGTVRSSAAVAYHQIDVVLLYSMSVSVDGFIVDREGAFRWSVPNDEQFRFHTAQVSELGGCLLGRRLYETMLLLETDPSVRDNEWAPRSPASDAPSSADRGWHAIPAAGRERHPDGTARDKDVRLPSPLRAVSTRPVAHCLVRSPRGRARTVVICAG